MHRNAGQERLASGASMFEGTVTLAAGHGGRTRAGGWPRGRDPRPRGASLPGQSRDVGPRAEGWPGGLRETSAGRTRAPRLCREYRLSALGIRCRLCRGRCGCADPFPGPSR